MFGGRGRPGPKKGLRRSLCVHSADKSKVYKSQTKFFWTPGPAWAQKCSVHSANKSSPKEGLGPKRVLDAACAYTRPRNPRPKQSLFGGRRRPGLLDAACAYTRPTNLRFTAPNKTFLLVGAGLSPKMILDAACAFIRPTIPRLPQTKHFWRPGPAWAPKGSSDAACA